MFNPHLEENYLRKLLRETDNPTSKNNIQRKLVQLYLKHGEYFKMNETPDPNLAEMYLKKALRLQEDHPVVNYRYAHILYRKNQYQEALNYFQRSIIGSSEEELNDTQLMLARMFIVNCCIFISKEILLDLEEMEYSEEIQIDEGLIQKYKQEIQTTNIDTFERMVYQLTTENEQKIISEHVLDDLLYDKSSKVVLFGKNSSGYFIHFKGVVYENINLRSFLILETILTSKTYRTNDYIRSQISTGEDISEDGIRQSISRLYRRIRFLDEIIEEGRVAGESNRIGRRLHPDYSYALVYRADEIPY